MRPGLGKASRVSVEPPRQQCDLGSEPRWLMPTRAGTTSLTTAGAAIPTHTKHRATSFAFEVRARGGERADTTTSSSRSAASASQIEFRIAGIRKKINVANKMSATL